MAAANTKMKYVTLLILVVQSTLMVLILRYSRTIEGKKYIISTAVVSAELLKMFICISIVSCQLKFRSEDIIVLLKREFLVRWRDCLKLAVPSALYTIQNNLLFIALSNLDAATYQVTYQLKILTTAMFSVIMLQRTLTYNKWIALVMLMCGVAFVQMPTSNPEEPSNKLHGNTIIGLVSVLSACISSGFAGVYFEKILKGSDQSVWLKNIQLGMFGVVFGLFAAVSKDGAQIMEAGFFQGYSGIVWLVVLNQAASGLIVAAVIKYADNILKGFATSVSIILSSILSYFILGDFYPSVYFVIGSSIVISATFCYGYEPKVKQLTTTRQ